MPTPVENFAAAVTTNFAVITEGINRLHALIVAFNNSPGTLSPSDQAMLDGIQAASATLATAAASVDNPVVPPTP